MKDHPFYVRNDDSPSSRQVTVYVAVVRFSTPATDGAWYQHRLECPHEHRDYDEAKACQERLAKRVDRLLRTRPDHELLGLSRSQLEMMADWEGRLVEVKLHVPGLVVQDAEELSLWSQQGTVINPWLKLNNDNGQRVRLSEQEAGVMLAKARELSADEDRPPKLRRAWARVMTKIEQQLERNQEGE